MGDDALCRVFGTTLEEVEADVERYEAGEFSDFDFSRVKAGRPGQGAGGSVSAPDSDEPSGYDEQRILKMVEDYRAGRLETVTYDELRRSLGLDG